MEIDPVQYSLVAAYLRRLPHGLESYPECMIKTDVMREAAADFPQLSGLDGLPPIVAQLVAGSYREVWFPEVAANAFMLVVRDTCFKNDEDLLAWQREYIGRVFDKPIYRVVMHVFSTSLAVMGAAKRWATFHRGTRLSAEPIKKLEGRYQASAILSYPPHLYDALLLRQIAATYLAALDANRAEDPRVAVEEKGPGEALFSASWKA